MCVVRFVSFLCICAGSDWHLCCLSTTLINNYLTELNYYFLSFVFLFRATNCLSSTVYSFNLGFELFFYLSLKLCLLFRLSEQNVVCPCIPSPLHACYICRPFSPACDVRGNEEYKLCKSKGKCILQWKPIGARTRGRPRKRWIAGIEEDLQIMGVR